MARAPSPAREARALPRKDKLIPFVFFHRLRFSHARVACLRPPFLVPVLLENILQNHRDHRRGGGTAVGGAADIAFIYRRESVLRFFRGHEPGEPRRGSFLVLWSP